VISTSNVGLSNASTKLSKIRSFIAIIPSSNALVKSSKISSSLKPSSVRLNGAVVAAIADDILFPRTEKSMDWFW